MTRAIELVIFDCDGVLVDSERLAVRVDVRVLAELGWPLTEREIIERFVGRSDAFMKAEIEAHLGRPLAPDWEDAFQHLYREAFAAELTPVPGVVEALDAITLPTCVASSGTHDKMRYTLGLTGLYDRFAGRVRGRRGQPLRGGGRARGRDARPRLRRRPDLCRAPARAGDGRLQRHARPAVAAVSRPAKRTPGVGEDHAAHCGRAAAAPLCSRSS